MIQLRPATLADLPILQHWACQPHIVQAGIAGWDWESDIIDDADYQQALIAELGTRPLGFIQILDPARDPEQYWGKVPDNLRAIDIFIGEADCLGQGLGTAMMTLAIERCFDTPAVTGILVDPITSNTRAHTFYRRLGFRFQHHRVFAGDACSVFHLDRQCWQSGHA